MSELEYSRVIIKLSGAALAGEQEYGIDPQIIKEIGQQKAGVVHGKEQVDSG